MSLLAPITWPGAPPLNLAPGSRDSTCIQTGCSNGMQSLSVFNRDRLPNLAQQATANYAEAYEP